MQPGDQLGRFAMSYEQKALEILRALAHSAANGRCLTITADFGLGIGDSD